MNDGSRAHGELGVSAMTARSHGSAIASEPGPVSPPLLFSDRRCPFAHRVLALLEHLAVSVERRESRIGDKPDGLALYFASERIPLLAHRDLVLTESRVILEYLAEFYEFSEAYPEDLIARTQHRHAMAMVDSDLTPLLFDPTRTFADLRLADLLRVLERATATTEPRPCLLTLHVAPIWNALRSWQPSGSITRAIEARTTLHRWLEAAADLDCVVRTTRDPATLKQDLDDARLAGLVTRQLP